MKQLGQALFTEWSRYNKRVMFLTIFGVVLFRLYYVSFGSYATAFPLTFDETTFWIWSHSWDWGYFSRPPMIAWVLGIFTEVCGHSALCIKSPSIIAHAVTAFVVYLIARRLADDERTGYWAGVLYLTLPGVTLSSTFLTNDSLLLMFWALGLHAFLLALNDDEDRWWLLLGLWTGFGLLTKYTMVLFPLSCILYMAISRTNRIELVRARFWIAMTLAIVLFSPNYMWNALYAYSSLERVTADIFNNELTFHIQSLGSFLIAQVALFGPATFTLLIIMIGRFFRTYEESAVKVSFCFVFPLLVVAVMVSLLFGAQPHWAAPIYIAATFWVVIMAFKEEKVWIIKVSVLLHVIMMLLYLHIHMLIVAFNFPNPFARYYPWKGLQTVAYDALSQYPNSVLIADDSRTVSMLAYTLRQADGSPYPIQKWFIAGKPQDHFDLTTQINLYDGFDMILITESKDLSAIKPYFYKVKQIGSRELYGREFISYHLHNFMSDDLSEED